MIAVVVEWNTDEHGTWVDDEDRQPIEGEDVLTNPCSIFGPFDDKGTAVKWLQEALPDDMDVFDMYDLDREFPEWWTINDPKEFPQGYKEVVL